MIVSSGCSIAYQVAKIPSICLVAEVCYSHGIPMFQAQNSFYAPQYTILVTTSLEVSATSSCMSLSFYKLTGL